MNTNDADWVEDVRRWYFNGGRQPAAAVTGGAAPVARDDAADVGYEAAQPSLESQSWVCPAATAFGRLG